MATEHALAARSKDEAVQPNAVLERHHLHSTFSLLAMPQFDILQPLSPDDRRAVRALVIELVLATDLAKHFE